jgi:hypothetical protein
MKRALHQMSDEEKREVADELMMQPSFFRHSLRRRRPDGNRISLVAYP